MLYRSLIICVIAILFTSCARGIESGLVAYYPFDGNAEDKSGNGLDGVVEGPILSADRRNQADSAYEFTGNRDVIIVKDNDLLDIKDQLTIAVWINLYSSNQNGSRLIDKGVNGAGQGFLLDIYHPDSRVTQKNTIRFIGTEGFTSITKKEVTTKEWNHLAVSYNGGKIKIYLNGEVISITREKESIMTPHNEDLEIGNGIYSSGRVLYYPFRGKMDEVRIYHRVLNIREVRTLMNL